MQLAVMRQCNQHTSAVRQGVHVPGSDSLQIVSHPAIPVPMLSLSRCDLPLNTCNRAAREDWSGISQQTWRDCGRFRAEKGCGSLYLDAGGLRTWPVFISLKSQGSGLCRSSALNVSCSMKHTKWLDPSSHHTRCECSQNCQTLACILDHSTVDRLMSTIQQVSPLHPAFRRYSPQRLRAVQGTQQMSKGNG